MTAILDDMTGPGGSGMAVPRSTGGARGASGGGSGKSSGGGGSKSGGGSSGVSTSTKKLDDDEKVLKKLARAQRPQRTLTKPAMKRSGKR